MRSTPSRRYGHDRISNERKRLGYENFELQLAVDEALARELQAMEDQLANASLNDSNGWLCTGIFLTKEQYIYYGKY
jgi:E3 ubiquitin-protein ligase BIG BROTHER and related proteins